MRYKRAWECCWVVPLMQLLVGVVCLDGSGEVVKSRTRPFYLLSLSLSLFLFLLGAAVTRDACYCIGGIYLSDLNILNLVCSFSCCISPVGHRVPMDREYIHSNNQT